MTFKLVIILDCSRETRVKASSSPRRSSWAKNVWPLRTAPPSVRACRRAAPPARCRWSVAGRTPHPWPPCWTHFWGLPLCSRARFWIHPGERLCWMLDWEQRPWHPSATSNVRKKAWCGWWKALALTHSKVVGKFWRSGADTRTCGDSTRVGMTCVLRTYAVTTYVVRILVDWT